jgi:16S rRNA processing protein RimM
MMERNFSPDRKTIAGKLTGVYGVKGWIKVHSYTEPLDNIFMYQPWFIADACGKISDIPISIDDHRLHGKGLIVHIKGVDDRDQALNYCQRFIAVDMGTLPLLPEGDYYWEQLKGLQVLSVYGGRDNAPVLLGMISDLMETGANDVLVVIPCENSIDKRERLLPYVDAHVMNVDLAAGTIIVDWDPEF